MKYNKLTFMLDLETEGVSYPTDKILEIGIVPMEFKDGYWHPIDKHFHRYLHTDKKPSNAFAKKYQTELYQKCNKSKNKDLKKIRKEMFEYFESFGIKSPNIVIAGLNVGNFDLAFLRHNKILNVDKYVGEKLFADHDYTPYELGGIIHLFSDHKGLSHKEVIKFLQNEDPIVKIPSGSEHTAIYDNYNQIKIINGALHQLKLKK